MSGQSDGSQAIEFSNLRRVGESIAKVQFGLIKMLSQRFNPFGIIFGL